MQGWESAALFVQGVKLAGHNLTRANVIAAGQLLDAPSRPAASRPR